jgi:hypothetical protein
MLQTSVSSTEKLASVQEEYEDEMTEKDEAEKLSHLEEKSDDELMEKSEVEKLSATQEKKGEGLNKKAKAKKLSTLQLRDGDEVTEKIETGKSLPRTLPLWRSGIIFDPAIDNSDECSLEHREQQKLINKRIKKQRQKCKAAAKFAYSPPSPPKPDFFQVMRRGQSKWLEENGYNKDTKSAYVGYLRKVLCDWEEEDDDRYKNGMPETPNIEVSISLPTAVILKCTYYHKGYNILVCRLKVHSNRCRRRDGLCA